MLLYKRGINFNIAYLVLEAYQNILLGIKNMAILWSISEAKKVKSQS